LKGRILLGNVIFGIGIVVALIAFAYYPYTLRGNLLDILLWAVALGLLLGGFILRKGKKSEQQELGAAVDYKGN
jgi:multisubunit Na+/H+ antiporter MnhB subunit